MSELYSPELLALANTQSALSAPQAGDICVSADNPLCGDSLQLQLRLSHQRIAHIAIAARGCILCRAAANLLRVRAAGMPVAAVESISEALQQAMAQDPAQPWPLLGWSELQLFAPVRQHRARHQCVFLPFAALRDGLAGVSC